MTVYKIRLMGCDDTTEFAMELTAQEKDFVLKMVQESEENSSYGCMPTMGIEEKKEEEDND